MLRLLANENTPREAVLAARNAGHDVVWMVEHSPGSHDDSVLQLARVDDRVLLTFDKDFGELVFRLGRDASPGIILCRPRLRSPESITSFVMKVLIQQIDWRHHFAVARESMLRVVPLPLTGNPSSGKFPDGKQDSSGEDSRSID